MRMKEVLKKICRVEKHGLFFSRTEKYPSFLQCGTLRQHYPFKCYLT